MRFPSTDDRNQFIYLKKLWLRREAQKVRRGNMTIEQLHAERLLNAAAHHARFQNDIAFAQHQRQQAAQNVQPTPRYGDLSPTSLAAARRSQATRNARSQAARRTTSYVACNAGVCISMCIANACVHVTPNCCTQCRGALSWGRLAPCA